MKDCAHSVLQRNRGLDFRQIIRREPQPEQLSHDQ
ncbi:unnamed protein product, partial [Protopolystoma xenopodis]